MAYFLDDFPRTEYGAILENKCISESKYSDMSNIMDECCAVYKIYEDGNYYFDSLWDNRKSYNRNSIVLLAESCIKKHDSLEAGMAFANVLGSTGDSIPAGNTAWRKMIEKLNRKFKMVPDYDFTVCCANPLISGEPNDTAFIPSPRFARYKDYLAQERCNDSTSHKEQKQIVCGGHVILDRNAKEVASGDDVFIVPICQHHNTLQLPGCKRGQGYYMETRTLTPAAVVKYRIDGALVEAYLEEHPDCSPDDF